MLKMSALFIHPSICHPLEAQSFPSNLLLTNIENDVLFICNCNSYIYLTRFDQASWRNNSITELSGVTTGGMEGSGPPTSVQTPLGISANPLKSFFHIWGGGGGTSCMYIVTFTAHQQRNMVRTPPLFWSWRRH